MGGFDAATINTALAAPDKSDINQGLTALEVAQQITAMGYLVPGPRIVVLRDPMDDKKGSIYVPDIAKREKRLGTIVALGAAIDDPEDIIVDTEEERQMRYFADVVRLGQRVAFTKYDALQIDVRLVEKLVTLDFMHWKDIYILAPWNKADEDAWKSLLAQQEG